MSDSAPLHLDSDELVACVACGLCLPHCPTYRVTGHEIASPRGRIAAMRAVQFDRAPLNAAFATAMEECVQCRACEAACPSSVPFGHLMEGAREALYEARGSRSVMRRVAEWIAYRLVLPRRRVLRLLTWFLLVAQRLRLVPARFRVSGLSSRSLRMALTPSRAGVVDAWLFPGCVMDAWMRPVHAAALRVMEATGAVVALPAGGRAACCGALHSHAGRAGDARALAARVVAAFPGSAPIVVDSAGCSAAMKEYGRLLGTPSAIAFSARVRDFAEWVVEVGVPSVRRADGAVVVQDPCHLRHVQRQTAPVRSMLGAAFAVVSEPADDGLCCGAGGAYSVLQPTLSTAIRDRKVEALRAVGGPGAVVASANPGCIMQLRAGGIDARHPAELMAEMLDG